MLNALRHHGEGDPEVVAAATALSKCSTPCGITARATGPAHDLESGDAEVCSTPCGITARATPPAPTCSCSRREVLNALRHHGEGDMYFEHEQERWEAVLNALRHHGEGDPSAFRTRVASSVCSTPCGITARATMARSPEGPRRALSCSTPCGITARATPHPVRVHGHDRVLNALRHHGEGDEIDPRAKTVID